MILRAIRTTFLVTAILSTLGACETLNVTSDVNAPLIHTVQCHTVAWAGTFQGNNALLSTIANPVNESRLRAAIQGQLASRGVQLAASGADCLVGYGIGVRNVVDEDPYGWGWGAGWGWGWYPRGWWNGPGTYGPYVYREGLIAVDLYDGRTRQPLWHAYVHQDLYGLTGSKAEERINAAVAAIFLKYPG